MICGDFNLIYRDEDKNNGNLHRRMMGRFRRLISDLALKEVYLNGRRYTWSNEQSPTLVHLDRVLCTSDWEEAHAACSLRCLASVISVHSPLFLDYAPVRLHIDGSTSRTCGCAWTASTPRWTW
uniref:Endonuclease/exonuclease/phosphatase domain-containing protein n=1 Tax=Aegilops tauschii subsp. strangulata TaxID=200361 RepID=A0A453BHH0_AEGTS